MSSSGRIYIEEMAEILGRAVITIRSWVREGDLPAELEPEREGGRNKIYWVHGQVNGMKKYAAERSARRGWQHAT